MMRPGMHKPPIAPKPKLVQPQKPRLSPSTPLRDGLSLLSPGAPRRVKPALAPKPCLSKLTPAEESKPLTSKTLHQPLVREAQRNEGLLNSQKEIQHENKKPDWDYIIPICLCSHENCTCIRNTSANIDKMQKDLKHLHKATGNTEENKKPLPAPQVTVGNKMITACGKSYLTNHKPLQNTLTVERNLNTDNNNVTRPPGPHRTWSDEANGNVVPQNEAGLGLDDDDAFGSEQTSQSRPVFGSPKKPAPVLWKQRMAVLTHQEKVEEEREDTTSQEGIDINVKEVKVLLEGKKNSSLSAGVPVEKQPVLSAGKACAVPDPPPRMKPFLTTPATASTSGVRSLPKDVEEEDLGWDSSCHEMDLSFDKGDEVVEEKKEEICDQEAACTDFTRSPGGSLCPTVRVTIDEELIKGEKPQRPVGPMALLLGGLNESSKEKEEEKVMDNEKSGTPLKDERPLSPAASRTFLTPAPIKPSRASLSKQKSKSFSGADLVRSEGQGRNSFRKLLELKLTMKMIPKLITKGGQSQDGAANYIEQSVDGEHFLPERKLSCPLIGVEQCVDGDDLHYENISYYEDISDYVNMAMGKAVTAPLSPSLQHTAWQSPAYDDEGIYEDPEPYVPFARNTELHQCLTPTDCERSSVDEEVTPFDDGHSDEDILANSSDEEDDSSSISSKGDPERPEERQTRHGQKKKIHHIAREIMTSEGVFVDVLKLLHVDFRGAVSKASRQIGKPVIEDCLLNQILYSLPQLYELNQDLLRELEQRVVKWDEHAQLADIFLKKGPYLKMYSTYIREFDKNVALLEEQSKRNLAFGAVVREFEASPRCANLALKHYLLKPVQRIPQYQLLLTDYLKNLSEDSNDYKDTQAALAIVKEVANHANDIMKQGDNFQKLFEVQSSLTGHHEIVQPGRVFLKEGVLNKLSRKVMQPRMFFLFNDTLLYTTPVQSGQYKLKNMMSLAGLKVSKPSQEAYQNELNIESVERSFILSASSASERDEWLEAISRAINDYTKKKISFIPGKPLQEVDLLDSDDDASLGSKAPIWIPDSRTTMCMICTCDFTLTWRRHHCRACGKVVCQSCSANKWCLAYRKNELGRVCDKCFPILRQQKSKQALPASVSPANKAALPFSRKQKKIPAALKEVSANTDSSMSGYLQRSKGNKKQGKRLWFVIKDKVLYTYAASEDIAALESQPLLGFVLKVDSPQKLQFKLYHKNTLYYMFKADDLQTAQRWIESFKEATVL